MRSEDEDKIDLKQNIYIYTYIWHDYWAIVMRRVTMAPSKVRFSSPPLSLSLSPFFVRFPFRQHSRAMEKKIEPESVNSHKRGCL